MLTLLSIKNIVLVKNLDINMDNRLNVITGETGAGKSIIINAIELVIGGKSSSCLIRHGAEKASVIATFNIDNNHIIWNVLKNLDIEFDKNEDIILKRIINKDGKSKASINDIPVTVKILKTVGQQIVDVQGQFEQYGLLNTNQHMFILDNFAKSNDLKDNLSKLYNIWKNTENEYNKQFDIIKQNKDDTEYIEHCLNELKDADIQENEEQILLQQKYQLKNTDKLLQTYQNVYDNINNDNAVDDLLRKTEISLENIVDFGKDEIKNILEKIINIKDELQNISSQIKDFLFEIQDKYTNLEDVENRLYLLENLAKKHRLNIYQLPSVYKNLCEKFEIINNSDSNLEKLNENIIKAKDEYIKQAHQLTKIRKNKANELAEKINIELHNLSLEDATFSCIVNCKTEINLKNCSKNGIDNIVFMIKTNQGQKLSPIHKSASGGELSRILLSINIALKDSNTKTTLIFDEIDAGVGGKSATSIGNRLKYLAQTHQVFAITHSPQVASCANSHFYIKKQNIDNNTISSMKKLNNSERVIEIARMLSGNNITQTAIANAESFINND